MILQALESKLQFQEQLMIKAKSNTIRSRSNRKVQDKAIMKYFIRLDENAKCTCKSMHLHKKCITSEICLILYMCVMYTH